jgi:hypothetical protein
MAARASDCALVTGFLFSSNLWYSFCRAGASFLMGINHFIGSIVSVPALIWGLMPKAIQDILLQF